MLAAPDDDARFSLYQRFLPLIVFEQQPGVGVRKEILRMRGLVGDAVVRAPGGGASEAQSEAARRILGRVVGRDTDLTVPLDVFR